MARPPRPIAPNTFHHVVTRGNNRDPIFLDVEDRLRFLAQLETSVFEYRWRCHAFVLMSNHYHLLLELREPSLAQGMCLLNGVYARRFNRKHRRESHVFGQRFWSKLVKGEAQFKENARYIVNNPVRAGMCANASDYFWSSHLATLGKRQPPGCLTTSFLLRQFGADPRSARNAYKRFVDAAIEVELAAHGPGPVPGRGQAGARQGQAVGQLRAVRT